MSIKYPEGTPPNVSNEDQLISLRLKTSGPSSDLNRGYNFGKREIFWRHTLPLTKALDKARAEAVFISAASGVVIGFLTYLKFFS